MAFDPTAALGPICQREGIWLHVDAAMSGIAALAPEYRWVNAGTEYADSYCTNPHKWMGVNFDCNLYWTADRAALLDVLGSLPEYLGSQAAEAGADTFVAGSAVFGAADPDAAIAGLRASAARGAHRH